MDKKKAQETQQSQSGSKKKPPGNALHPAPNPDNRAFAITDTFLRNPTSKKPEFLLKTAAITEEVKIVGPISIFSVV